MARPRAADHEEKKASILAVSAELIASEGYDRASMAMIGRRCGVSKALLYHYYDSKQALLFAILSEYLDFLRASLADIPEGLTPAKRLRALVGALLAAYEDADAEHKILINDIALLPDALQGEIRAREREIVAIFAEALSALPWRDGQRERLLKPATMSLLGMLNWLYHWYRPGGGISREDYADLATSLMVGGVRGLSETQARAAPQEAEA